MIKNFTDLETWKEAHKLTLVIYKATKFFPKEEVFGMISQLRRKDRLNFYYDARGSISEVESQLITSKDLEYIKESDFKRIFEQAEKIGRILSGLIRSTENLSRGK